MSLVGLESEPEKKGEKNERLRAKVSSVSTKRFKKRKAWPQFNLLVGQLNCAAPSQTHF